MKSPFKHSTVKYLIILLPVLVMLAGCNTEKKTWFNRNMQNLTTHYNILFNAREIIRLKEESYATAFIDNYNEVLNVYQDTIAQTATLDKDLDAAQVKANNIINLKEQSHYQGDAYLVLGKVNFLEANYFNAAEYFTYVTRRFPAQYGLVQDALTWKARALIYLGQLPQAKLAADSALQNIDPKKGPTAEVYAAKLQYDIAVQDYADAEQMAKNAVKYCHNKPQQLRLTFILAQVQELNNNTAEAFKNYTRIAKSNSSFEMAFNASLNRIRIEDVRNGIKSTRIDRLLELLKDPNNKEFKDQIYYQVAQLYLAAKDYDKAIKYLNLSVRSNLKDQSQKGLSYLRLAEIYFKNKTDYLRSKKYYDSTLTSLPANYPGYRAIQKMGNNLQVLADRLQIIAREDTLQALAKMDEKTRATVIDKMVSDNILQQQAVATAQASASSATASAPGQTGGNSSFYFYNTNAVSQGQSDFKKKWGNRKLEDNWRRSSRSNSDITNNQANAGLGSNDPFNQAPAGGRATATGGAYRQELLRNLPLTPALLAQSNQRIYNAYMDIAAFYRDILEDKKDAIATFELLLKLFPNDPNKPAIYYSLYRLYSDIDIARSNDYKNRLLKDYPDTPFAKVISDPDYVKKLGDKDAEFTQAYNNVFDLYANKKYQEVMAAVPALMARYPGNRFSAQLYYLKVIAEGHGESVAPFRDSLQMVAAKYPTDKLIAPLLKQHLAYIDANMAEISTRPVVLADNDPKDIPFTLANELKKQTEYRKVVKPYIPPAEPQQVAQTKPPVAAPKPVQAAPPVVTPKPVQTAQVPTPPVVQPATPSITSPTVTSTLVPQQPTALPAAINTPAANPPLVVTQNPGASQVANPPVTQTENTATLFATPATTQPAIAPDSAAAALKNVKIVSIFSMNDSTNYYFAVNVASGTTNLSSSRFGFGQFNRANYAGKGIKHDLIAVGDNNQVIFVGRFLTLDGVKKYARAIIPLLPDIMKVPRDKYSFFIITKENLDKLADKKTLDSYTDYYQKNY